MILVAVVISALAMSLALRPAAANATNIADGVNSSSVGDTTTTVTVDGAYFRCRGIVSNDGVSTGATNGGTITSDVECYTDNPSLTINPVKSAASTCPPNDVQMGQVAFQPFPQRLCGDGLGANVASTPCYWNCAGAAPRTQFGARPEGRGNLSYVPAGGHTFKGTYERNGVGVADDTLRLKGCFTTTNTILGTVYADVTLNYSATASATGTADIYLGQPALCAGSPSGGIPLLAKPVLLTEEEAVTPSTDPNAMVQTSTTDYDMDGCTDVRELGANKSLGGLRDGMNSYDAWDLAPAVRDKKATVADILATVNKFGRKETDGTAVGTHSSNPFPSTPAGTYGALYDRGAAGGGVQVNLGPGDGQVTVADILGSVSQFGMNCS